MSEPGGRARPVIPQELMLSRLARSDEMREFFIQMWLQNPVLARQAGARVQSLLSPLAQVDAEKNLSSGGNLADEEEGQDSGEPR